MIGDGNCLFRACSKAITGDQTLQSVLRELSFFSSRGGGGGGGGAGGNGGDQVNIIDKKGGIKEKLCHTRGIKHFCSTASKKKLNGYV